MAEKKKVALPLKQPATAKEWLSSDGDGGKVEGRNKAINDPEGITRYSFDLGKSLHRRAKMQAAERDTNLADIMRAFMEREFPEKK